MSYVTVDSCIKCGSPMYAPAVWYGITPAPLTRTCGCYDWAKSVTEEYIPEKSQTEQELVTLLSDYVGETGESESAVEVLSRLLTELEELRRSSAHLRSAARAYIATYEGGHLRPERDYKAFKQALGEGWPE